MKELDFDELDKAVNSLMGDVPQTEESSINNQNVTTTTSGPVEPSDEGSQIISPPTDAAVEEVTSPSLPSPASRRGGRFMDVVHPSSDMKTTRMAVPSREGVSITPPISETPTTPAPEQNTPIDEVTPPVEAAVETPASSEWPDPIALHEEKNSDKSEEPALEITAPAPLTSPFLTGAKVEKRPLGGSQALDQAMANELSNVDAEQSVGDTSSVDTPISSTTAEERPAEAPAPESTPQLLPTTEEKAPLPAELASDLVAIEAGGAAASEGQTTSSTALEPAEAPAAPVIGGGSIQQQYTEQPSTGDESHAAIYDTDAAQQPLLHPPKKKTGWLVIIWIVLIIILGVGVGATIWYFGLI